MTIGLIDSGIGGLSVVRALHNHSMIYFADTAHFPFGDKDTQTLISYAANAVEFLIEKGATTIIFACNTLSAAAFSYIRATLSIPVYELIASTCNRAVTISTSKKIGIIATENTVRAAIFTRLLPSCTVFSSPCPLLAPIVEYGCPDQEAIQRIVHAYLYPLLCANVDTLILGCTHYAFLIEYILRAAPNIILVDPAESLSLPETNASLTCYVSGSPEHFRQRAEAVLKRPVVVYKK